jgi:hypothetical protein
MDMKRRAVAGLSLALALVALVLAPGTAQAGLIEATATLTALGNTSPIAADTVIFTGTQTVSGAVEFSGTIGETDGGDPGAHWRLDLTATGFTIATDCIEFDNSNGGNCVYPNGLRLTLSGLTFSPAATLVDLTVLPVSPPNLDALTVSGTPLVGASSVVIDFQAYLVSSASALAETVFSAQFVSQPVAATPLPGALVLVALGGLGAAALAIYRGRA